MEPVIWILDKQTKGLKRFIATKTSTGLTVTLTDGEALAMSDNEGVLVTEACIKKIQNLTEIKIYEDWKRSVIIKHGYERGKKSKEL